MYIDIRNYGILLEFRKMSKYLTINQNNLYVRFSLNYVSVHSENIHCSMSLRIFSGTEDILCIF